MDHRHSKEDEMADGKDKVEAAAAPPSVPIHDVKPETELDSKRNPTPDPKSTSKPEADSDPTQIVKPTSSPVPTQSPSKPEPQSQLQAQPQPHVHPLPRPNVSPARSPGVIGTPKETATGMPTTDAAASSSPTQTALPGTILPTTTCPSGVNKECPTGQYCTFRNTCSPMHANGKGCASNAQCASGACQAGLCVAAASASAQSSLTAPIMVAVISGILALIALLYAFCRWYERRIRRRGAAEDLRRNPTEVARAALGEPTGYASSSFESAGLQVVAASNPPRSMAQLYDPTQHMHQSRLMHIDRNVMKDIWDYSEAGSPTPLPHSYTAPVVDHSAATANAAYCLGARPPPADSWNISWAHDHDGYVDESFSNHPAVPSLERHDRPHGTDPLANPRMLWSPRNCPSGDSTVGDTGEISYAEYSRYKAAAASAAVSYSGSRPAASQHIGTLLESDFYPTVRKKNLAVVNAAVDDYEESSPGCLDSLPQSPLRNGKDAFTGRGVPSKSATAAQSSGEGPVSYQVTPNENSTWAAYTTSTAPRLQPGFSKYDDRVSTNGNLERKQVGPYPGHSSQIRRGDGGVEVDPFRDSSDSLAGVAVPKN